MAKEKYEHCIVGGIRDAVETRLKLPAPKSQRESAAEFWSRVEHAGLLSEALALYDRLAVQEAERARVRRETKKAFAQRIEREGRQDEAAQVRAELLASGLSQREAQVELVARLQPLDGSETRAWQTPDPWESGRLFQKKADQKYVMAKANEDEDEEAAEARHRLAWAEYRQKERVALAAARRRLRALKAAAPDVAGSQGGATATTACVS
jgi:hypothetical protein